MSSPLACIDIYPPEGGQYSIRNGQVLSVKTSKNIRSEAGTFSITLAPGGPNGLNVGPPWSQIITPMSLVVIGLARGQRQGLPMVGVATAIAEPQQWQEGQPVQRFLTISGRDLGHYLTFPDWYSLFVLGALGGGISYLATALTYGTPQSIGQAWYDKVFTQTFSGTTLPYNNSSVPLPTAIGTQFDAYAVTIPAGDFFVGGEGWWGKFKQIFPWPWYETFLNTAPTGTYSAAGTSFTTSALNLTGGVTLVARLNPLPDLVSSAGSNGAPSFTGMDLSKWNALASGTPDEGPRAFISSVPSFGDGEVANFYTLNPTALTSTFGNSNSNTTSYLYAFSAAIDKASAQRYGYRPADLNFRWLWDSQGTNAQGSSSGEINDLVGKLLSRACSYHEPSPLMMRSAFTSVLRPDVTVGTKWSYAPYKDGTLWTFYVEQVDHNWTFGGPSTTTLGLSRGLPATVYANSDLLLAIHTGNAQRQNGQYQSGLPAGAAAPLAALSVSEYTSFVNQLRQPYITAQSP